MRSLILHPTPAAQWQAIVHEAQESCAIYLKEDLESYLVFLLMRSTTSTAIASSVLGLDFLEGVQRIGTSRHALLQEVGDQCLLTAGLFPERAARKRVKLSYFVRLGQTAYGTLSNELFIQLCHEFPRLMDVLQATRETPAALTLLQTLELWVETRSQLAWKRLHAATNGTIVINDQDKSVH